MSRMPNWYEVEALVRDREVEVANWTAERRQAKLAARPLQVRLWRWLTSVGVALLRLQAGR